MGSFCEQIFYLYLPVVSSCYITASEELALHSPVNTSHTRRRHATGGDENGTRAPLESSSSIGGLEDNCISESEVRHVGLMKSASDISCEKSMQEANWISIGDERSSSAEESSPCISEAKTVIDQGSPTSESY